MPPLPPADHLAIQSLHARYNHAIHLGDGVAWAACFTADGVFSNARERVSGAEALAAYAAEFSKARNARYWVDNLLLEATPTGARGTCYLLLLHIGQLGQPAAVALTGIYTDQLVKVGDEWKFAARNIERDR